MRIAHHNLHPTITVHVVDEGANYFIGNPTSSIVQQFLGGQFVVALPKWEWTIEMREKETMEELFLKERGVTGGTRIFTL